MQDALQFYYSEISSLTGEADWNWRPEFQHCCVSARQIRSSQKHHSHLALRRTVLTQARTERQHPGEKGFYKREYGTYSNLMAGLSDDELRRLEQETIAAADESWTEIRDMYLSWICTRDKPWFVRVYGWLVAVGGFSFGKPVAPWADLWYQGVAIEFRTWLGHIKENYRREKFKKDAKLHRAEARLYKFYESDDGYKMNGWLFLDWIKLRDLRLSKSDLLSLMGTIPMHPSVFGFHPGYDEPPSRVQR